MQKKNTTTWFRILEMVLFLVILLAVWQGIYYFGVDVFGIWKVYTMPSPAGAAKKVVELFGDSNIYLAILTSLRRVLIGYVISILNGVLLGFLLSKFKFLRRNLKPVILGLQTLPSICWVPFAIIWFGLSESAIIFVVIIGSTFGVAMAVEDGLHNIDPILVRAGKTMGAKGVKLYTKVIFPASLPMLVSGLKQGWSFAWRALMSGEMMSASIGLGQVLLLGRDLADINQVMVVMIVIILIGVLVDRLVFSMIERRLRRNRGLDRDVRNEE